MLEHIKHWLIVLGSIAFLIFGWKELYKYDKKRDSHIASNVLSPSESTALILNPTGHTATIITKTGQKKVYLSPHTNRISVTKAGQVIIPQRTWGTEISPFVGFAYSDTGRLALGCSLFYIHRWEVSLSFFPTISGKFSLKAGVVVSYNVYSNTALFAGIMNDKNPVGGISFKF